MSKTAANHALTTTDGLTVDRRFTTPGVHPFDELIEVVTRDVALVGRPAQRGPELRRLESLPRTASLPHPEVLHINPLVGGQPVTARTRAAAPHGGAAVGGAGLDDAGLLGADRANHVGRSLLDT